MTWVKEVAVKERDEAKIASFLNNPVSRIAEDVGIECQLDSECLPSKDCPYYQNQQDLLKNLTNKTSKTNIVQHLRSLICNRQQRAVCCPNFSPEIQECGKPQNVPSNRKRAVGGEITTPGEFPFSVLIGRIFDRESEVLWNCSGVLINSQFVLTTAYCKGDHEMFKLRLGFHTLGDNSNLDIQNFDIKSENFVIHEDYDRNRGNVKRNDIALIKLPRPAKFTQLAQPSCWRTQSPLEDPLVVVGWGKTENFQGLTSEGVYSNSQHKLEVCNRCFAIHYCQVLVIYTVGASCQN